MYARESHDVSLSVGVGYVKKKLYDRIVSCVGGTIVGGPGLYVRYSMLSFRLTVRTNG